MRSLAAIAWLGCWAILLMGGVAWAQGSRADRRTPVVAAVERASPAVVNIAADQVMTVRPDPFFEEFFGRFFELQPEERQYKRRSLGSGLIVRPEGYVVTNSHVVARGNEITVVLADEREFRARVVGTDEDADLAILKIEGGGALPSVDFGSSEDLMIGETVIAIGNPFGFSHTVTTGVVSATGRSLQTEERSYLDFIQTDASINPGNSGGPLLNIQGELIGINTAIYGGAQNIGFALPADRARRIVDDLIRFGQVKRGHVGLHVQDLTPELAGGLGIDATRGVVVREVERSSPAEGAGIRVGEVIVSIDRHGVRSRREFDGRMIAVSEGARLTLEVESRGETRRVEIIAAALTDAHLDAIGWRRLGIHVRQRGKRTVVISEVRRQSHASRAGIRPGDILVALGQRATPTLEAFRRAVGGLRGTQPIQLAVQRGNTTYRLALPGDDS